METACLKFPQALRLLEGRLRMLEIGSWEKAGVTYPYTVGKSGCSAVGDADPLPASHQGQRLPASVAPSIWSGLETESGTLTLFANHVLRRYRLQKGSAVVYSP